MPAKNQVFGSRDRESEGTEDIRYNYRFVAASGTCRMLRSFRVRAFEGAVLESGFGDEEMILRNPLSETRVNYRAIKLLTARGEAVFMQQHGVPMGSV